MINPNVTPGVSTNKSAQTRFNNSQINAERATMPFNTAAQASLRNMKSSAKPGGNSVAPSLSPGPVLPQVKQSPVGPMPVPTQAEQIDPNTIKDNILNDVVAKIRQQQFIDSPQVKDAMTSIRLRNIFNATNPNAMPDNRDLMGRIKSRLGDFNASSGQS